MRTMMRTALALGFVGAMFAGSMAIGSGAPVGVTPAQAQGFYVDVPGLHVHVGPHHRYGGPRRYYDYYGGGTFNGCPPDWTIQGGVCKPYRHGPWDWQY